MKNKTNKQPPPQPHTKTNKKANKKNPPQIQNQTKRGVELLWILWPFGDSDLL